MKYSHATELWTNPREGMFQEFHHISYVLFRTDREDGEIVGARCPDMHRLAVGHSLPEVIGLDAEARHFLREESSCSRRLVVMTDIGVGVLDKLYDRQAGLGLLFHIHARPESIARLLNHGVLDIVGEDYVISQAIRGIGGEVTPRDMDSYDALTDAFRTLTTYPIGAFLPVNDRGDLYRSDLENRMMQMARFVGCGIRFSEEKRPNRIRCFRPLLLEALLLYLMTEVRMVSATRGADCRIATVEGEDGGHLALTVRYPIERTAPGTDLYEGVGKCHRHMSWACELGGMSLQKELHTPAHREKCQGTLLSEVCITAEWQHDPAVLPTTDLKAKIQILCEEETE